MSSSSLPSSTPSFLSKPSWVLQIVSISNAPPTPRSRRDPLSAHATLHALSRPFLSSTSPSSVARRPSSVVRRRFRRSVSSSLHVDVCRNTIHFTLGGVTFFMRFFPAVRFFLIIVNATHAAARDAREAGTPRRATTTRAPTFIVKGEDERRVNGRRR